MKVLANMWKNLDPEIKSHYQTIAENDKSRYFAEMKVFDEIYMIIIKICFPFPIPKSI